MNIRHETWMRPYFQVLVAVVAFVLLGQPFARSDNLFHRSVYLAILVAFFAAIFVVAYVIWPTPRPVKAKQFAIIALLFVAVGIVTWGPFLSRGGYLAPEVLAFGYLVFLAVKRLRAHPRPR